MTRNDALTIWKELLDWVESTVPMAGAMRGYLNMPHADNFGQRERDRLKAVEDEIDSVLWRLTQQTLFDTGRDELERKLETLREQYKAVWRDIHQLFVKTYPKSFAAFSEANKSRHAQEVPRAQEAQPGQSDAADVVTAHFNSSEVTRNMGIPIDLKPTPKPGHYLAQIASIEASEGKFGPQLKVGFNLGSGMELTSYFPAKATPKNKSGELLKAALGKLQPLSDSDVLIGCKLNLLLEMVDGKEYPSIKSMWPVDNGTPDAELGI